MYYFLSVFKSSFLHLSDFVSATQCIYAFQFNNKKA